MTKQKSKPKAATRLTARKNSKAASGTRSAPASSKSTPPPDTKHNRIVAMLQAPAGATIALDRDCDGLAAAFGSRISCGRGPQEARAQPCFREN
jgi:hypothetical protein